MVQRQPFSYSRGGGLPAAVAPAGFSFPPGRSGGAKPKLRWARPLPLLFLPGECAAIAFTSSQGATPELAFARFGAFSGAAGGTVYALAFAPGSRGGLAIGAYGGVTWAGTTGGDDDDDRLALGAAAVLSMAMSPDGRLLAAGCLDKRVRLFALDGNSDDDAAKAPQSASRDWIGFDGSVRAVAWSGDGGWLAAADDGNKPHRRNRCSHKHPRHVGRA